MFHVEQVLTTIKLKLLHYLTEIIWLGYGKVVSLHHEVKPFKYKELNKCLTAYKVHLYRLKIIDIWNIHILKSH